MRKSSRYTKVKGRPQRMGFIILLNVCAMFLNLKGIQRNSNRPKRVLRMSS